MSQILWTIGHSTRPAEEMIQLLRAHGIRVLVDVRSIPRSRHNPQFNKETFIKSLRQAGLQYAHEPDLGGLRKSRADSINRGWKNASFRGFADYMQTDAFWQALDKLMTTAKQAPTAIMCAEAVPWRCHRSLIADALVSRDWTVRHILTTAEAQPHHLTTFAKIKNGVLTYPEAADSSTTSRLF